MAAIAHHPSLALPPITWDLQIPLYAIFHPQTGTLDLYRLINDQYQPQAADNNRRYWLEELGLSLGVWYGKKALKYNAHHPLWHKRPDWFLVVGVPRLYDGVRPRQSYVVWQEGQSPEVVVELLSPGPEPGDLGRVFTGASEPAPAWL